MRDVLLKLLICVVVSMLFSVGCVSTEQPDHKPTPIDTLSLAPVTSSAPLFTTVPESTITPRPSKASISNEHARQLYWSNQEQAFIFSTWTSEQLSILDPETRNIYPFEVVELPEQMDESTRDKLQILEDAPYEISPDGVKLLYHRQGANGQGVELWFTDLNSGDARFVLTTTMQFDALSWFESIVWCNDGYEALLTRTIGESIQIWRFDIASGKIVDWYESLDAASQEILGQVSPTFIALSPDSHRLAFVASSQVPERDRLWLADLVTNHIRLVGPAYAGAIPLWSSDGQYIYFANGDEPHYFGSFDPENPVGFDRFDINNWQSVRLVRPEQLGSPNFRLWAISSDEQYILYGAAGSLGSPEDGIWLIEIR